MGSEPLRIPELIRFGEDFELDLRAYELRRGGRSQKLEPIPMGLLVLLVERRGELVTRDQIIERVWGKDVYFDTDNSINSAVRKLRQALRDDPERAKFILTVTGKGYRFVASIEEVAPPAALGGTPLQAAPSSDTVLLGKKISHYRIIQLLGGGGMGVVYRAEDLKLGRQVALKFLPGELASDPVAFERLQREARAASSLDHPNICSVYQLDEHESQPFIVMQLLEGETLREWIHKTDAPAPLSQVLEFANQILDGLEAAHEKGIIHRDIKPANIFITNRGQAKILDFGVAKFVDASDLVYPRQDGKNSPSADPQLTRTGASLGTPSYLSPEQINREKLDGRTDLFSFGLVLYEMATRTRAFSGNTVANIREAVLNQSPLPARELCPDLPEELERIISKALEKDRDQRYQSAKECRRDLERLRNRKKVGWRAAAALAATILIAAGTFYGIRRPRAPFHQIRMTQVTNNGQVMSSAVSPDGNYVAYTTVESVGGIALPYRSEARESIRLRDENGNETVLVPPGPTRYRGLKFSPDSRLLFFASFQSANPSSGSIYKIPVQGGTPALVISDISQPYEIAISPDGKRLAFVRSTADESFFSLMVAGVDGSGAFALATRRDPAGFDHVAWSPSGNAVATFAYTTENGVESGVPIEISLADGREKSLTSKHWYALWGLAWMPDGRGLIANTQEQNGGLVHTSLISSGSGVTTRITNDLDSYEDVSVTSDSRTLAATRANVLEDIWVGSAEQPDRVRPITSGGYSLDPGFDATGRLIYFHAMEDGDSIWTMASDGSNAQQLSVTTGGKDFHPRVSRDGKIVVFTSERTGHDHIWRMDTDGKNLKQLTASDFDARGYPDISADGKWIFYHKSGAEQGIWKVPVDGGPPVRLTTDAGRNPAVSPDGKSLAYYFLDGEGADATGIAVISCDGGPVLKRFPLPVHWGPIRWAPDGQALFVIQARNDVGNLWMQPLKGGAPQQFTHFDFDRTNTFDFSRDGKQLVIWRSRVTKDVVLLRDTE